MARGASTYDRGYAYALSVIGTPEYEQVINDHKVNKSLDPTDFDRGFADALKGEG